MKAAIVIASLGLSYQAVMLFYSFINNNIDDVLLFSIGFMAQLGVLLFAIRKIS